MTIQQMLLGGAGESGYNLTRSLRFRASASAYLNRTPASAGNRKTWTWSGWVKRGTIGTLQTLFSSGVSAGDVVILQFATSAGAAGDTLNLYTHPNSITTTQVFRDPSAWYHIVWVLDTTQATEANRSKLYINGVQVNAIAGTYPVLNQDYGVNQSTVPHAIGRYVYASDRYFDGYLAEVNFIDGQALTPSSFGSTNALTGVWQPAAYTGTYGTNGFYLPFTDNSALTTSSNVGLGKDFSGNGNYWTTNNISITAGVTYDSMTDVPTLTNATTANYCVFNPLAVTSGGIAAITEGNLKVVSGAVGGNGYATMAIPSSGKYYWEVTAGSGNSPYIGISAYLSSQTYSWQNTNSVFYSGSNGQKSVDSSATSYGSTYTTNDVIGVAVDVGASTITFYKNNVSQGAISHTFVDVFPCLTDGASGTADTFFANFGQRPFAFSPPTGYAALNAFNLP